MVHLLLFVIVPGGGSGREKPSPSSSLGVNGQTPHPLWVSTAAAVIMEAVETVRNADADGGSSVSDV